MVQDGAYLLDMAYDKNGQENSLITFMNHFLTDLLACSPFIIFSY